MQRSRRAPLVTALHALALLCAGCAAGPKVVPAGPDTYKLTSHSVRGESMVGWASAGQQRVQIYEDAGAYCKRQGKAFELVGERLADIGWGRMASVEVEFRCVAR